MSVVVVAPPTVHGLLSSPLKKTWSSSSTLAMTKESSPSTPSVSRRTTRTESLKLPGGSAGSSSFSCRRPPTGSPGTPPTGFSVVPTAACSSRPMSSSSGSLGSP